MGWIHPWDQRSGWGLDEVSRRRPFERSGPYSRDHLSTVPDGTSRSETPGVVSIDQLLSLPRVPRAFLHHLVTQQRFVEGGGAAGRWSSGKVPGHGHQGRGSQPALLTTTHTDTHHLSNQGFNRVSPLHRPRRPPSKLVPTFPGPSNLKTKGGLRLSLLLRLVYLSRFGLGLGLGK